MELLIMQFSPEFFFLLLGPNYLPKHPIFEHPQTIQ